MATMQTDFKHLITVKPKYCFECGHWRSNRCNVGYTTNEESRSCKQAISRKDLKKAGY